MPVEKRNPASRPAISREQLIQMASIKRSGPLPDSREYAAYENILPGAADRILRMAEKQADHRMDLERSVILGGLTNERLGLLAGVVVVVATLWATVDLAKIGMGGYGIAAVLAEIGSIVYAVRYVTGKRNEEREHKAKMQQDLDNDRPTAPSDTLES